MSLTPLLSAPIEISIHAFAAMAAFVLGLSQFARRKGDRPHRVLGWAWVGLMSLVAVTSLFVNTTCSFGPFSAIHLLTILTILTLPPAVMAARRHDVTAHRRAMTLLFAGALVIAGGFTFLPGRIMHDVAFGTRSMHERCWPS